MTVEEDRRKIYLPPGEWVDYWTKEARSCGWQEVETEQIPVYQRRLHFR